MSNESLPRPGGEAPKPAVETVALHQPFPLFPPEKTQQQRGSRYQRFERPILLDTDGALPAVPLQIYLQQENGIPLRRAITPLDPTLGYIPDLRDTNADQRAMKEATYEAEYHRNLNDIIGTDGSLYALGAKAGGSSPDPLLLPLLNKPGDFTEEAKAVLRKLRFIVSVGGSRFVSRSTNSLDVGQLLFSDFTPIDLGKPEETSELEAQVYSGWTLEVPKQGKEQYQGRFILLGDEAADKF